MPEQADWSSGSRITQPPAPREGVTAEPIRGRQETHAHRPPPESVRFSSFASLRVFAKMPLKWPWVRGLGSIGRPRNHSRQSRANSWHPFSTTRKLTESLPAESDIQKYFEV